MCVCVCGALVIAESIASSCQLTSYAGVRTGDNGLHLMNFPAGGFCAPPKTVRKQESTRYWWNKQNSITIRNIVCSDMVYITGRCIDNAFNMANLCIFRLKAAQMQWFMVYVSPPLFLCATKYLCILARHRPYTASSLFSGQHKKKYDVNKIRNDGHRRRLFHVCGAHKMSSVVWDRDLLRCSQTNSDRMEPMKEDVM